MIQTLKYAYQRITRGYDDRLFWDLSSYVDPMIVAHVKNLREDGHGHPTGLTLKKWNKVLDTILAGFVPEPTDVKGFKKYMKARQKSLILLAFYWDNLWD